MINYSIIIPHYNTPDLLKRCLDSIPQRDDIQTIVVDDCSSLDNILLLNKIEQEYPNTLFRYSKKNGGAGVARNIALQYATGEWVLFADADDYFLKDAFYIFDKYSNSKEDAILFGNKSISTDNKINTRGNFINNNISYFKRNLISAQTAFLCSWVPWAKMVKLNYIRSYCFQFDDVKYGNDVFWNAQIATNTDKIALSQEPVYAITQEDNSLTTNRNQEAFFIRYNGIKKVNSYLEEKNKTFLKQAITLEFATWARKNGILFYIKFIYNSIKNDLLFEGKEMWITFAKINRNFLGRYPSLFLCILFFTPSYLLKLIRK